MTSKAKYQFKAKGNYIDGAFTVAADPTGRFASISPADTKDELGQFSYSYADIDRAVDAAQKAFQSWRKVKPAERAECLKRYQAVLKKRLDEVTEAIARETGKPLWEAKTEANAMIQKVDITLTDGLKLIEARAFPGILPGSETADGIWSYRPLGVMAVLGPFNFPGHLPNGHIVPALATGNTVVFKPSEKTPLVGQIMAECFDEAQFPKGVFNLVQGEREVGRRISTHEGVSGVLFTGSYEVGLRIRQETLHHHWKLLALEMGGKNASIVLEDAPFETALREVFLASFISAGQRCSCTSRVLVHESLLDRFVERLHTNAKAFAIGHPFDNPFMGPVIDRSAVDRYLKFLGIGVREGAELVMRGKEITPASGHAGHYISPSIAVYKDAAATLTALRKSVLFQTEVFGPLVTVVPFKTDAEAIELANLVEYGLVASVFSKSRERYQEVAADLEVGLINWNRSTVGASSKLPFGGLKKSGNFLPTSVTASYYCTHPVATIEVAQPNDQPPSPESYPGLNWS